MYQNVSQKGKSDEMMEMQMMETQHEKKLTNSNEMHSMDSEDDDDMEKFVQTIHGFMQASSITDISFPRVFDDKKALVLQPSLFPYVPPTIYFALKHEPSMSLLNK